MNDDFNDIEEKIKEKDAEEKKTKHKVSGKSVFEIQEIIREKSQALKEGNADSRETLDRDE